MLSQQFSPKAIPVGASSTAPKSSAEAHVGSGGHTVRQWEPWPSWLQPKHNEDGDLQRVTWYRAAPQQGEGSIQEGFWGGSHVKLAIYRGTDQISNYILDNGASWRRGVQMWERRNKEWTCGWIRIGTISMNPGFQQTENTQMGRREEIDWQAGINGNEHVCAYIPQLTYWKGHWNSDTPSNDDHSSTQILVSPLKRSRAPQRFGWFQDWSPKSRNEPRRSCAKKWGSAQRKWRGHIQERKKKKTPQKSAWRDWNSPGTIWTSKQATNTF